MSIVAQTKHYIVEQSDQSQNVRVYHSRVRLLDEGWQVQGGHKGVCEAVDNEGEVHPVAAVLATLLEIDGVSFAEVRAYQAVVQKSMGFEWEPIHAEIMRMWDGIELAVNSTQEGFIKTYKLALHDPQIDAILRTLAEAPPDISEEDFKNDSTGIA